MAKKEVIKEEEAKVVDQVEDIKEDIDELEPVEKPRKRSVMGRIKRSACRAGRKVKRGAKKVAPIVTGILLGIGLGFGSALVLGTKYNAEAAGDIDLDEPEDIIDGEAEVEDVA